MSNELLTAIDRLVEEKTFNLDALEAIKDLRNKAQSLEDSLAVVRERADKFKIENIELRAEAELLQGRIDQYEAQASMLRTRQQQADEAVFESEKHKAVAEAYKDAMEIVFRPHAVRERVHQNIPVPFTTTSNGNGSTYVMNHTQSSDITKEDV